MKFHNFQQKYWPVVKTVPRKIQPRMNVASYYDLYVSMYCKTSNAVISILCLYLKKFKYEIKIWHDYRIQIAKQKYQRTD